MQQGPPELRVAVVQMTSTPDATHNLGRLVESIEAAAQQGAGVVLFPENAPLFAPDKVRIAAAESIDGATVQALRGAAAAHSVAVILGSFAEASPDPERTYNTCVAIDEHGEVAATYRKMHLFDVDVPGDGAYRESATVLAGEPSPVVVSLCGWRFGLSICYDLRFPEVYRAFGAAGVDAIVVPAAFTVPTGEAHWRVLLRARAIENQAYVLAPAQVGHHFGRRQTYGHALIVSPWGEVCYEAPGDVEACGLWTLERETIAQVRARIPALGHRRL